MYIPNDQEISRGPRDVPRVKLEGHLGVGGDAQPNSSRFEAVSGHSLIIYPSLGMYQEINPCRASSIDSVRINTSLPVMRECAVNPLLKAGHSKLGALSLRRLISPPGGVISRMLTMDQTCLLSYPHHHYMASPFVPQKHTLWGTELDFNRRKHSLNGGAAHLDWR